MSFEKTITVALTGASGIQYGLRLIDVLVNSNCRVYVLMSKPAKVVMGCSKRLLVTV